MFLTIGNLVKYKILILVVNYSFLFLTFNIDHLTDFSGVSEFLEEKVPCYILYRLDSKSITGDYEWLFLAYVPDLAKVFRK